MVEVNAGVVGLLLAALYRPVSASAIQAPSDFAHGPAEWIGGTSRHSLPSTAAGLTPLGLKESFSFLRESDLDQRYA